jgi:hypothetical protein
MKEVIKYQCEHCKVLYAEPAKAAACEKRHACSHNGELTFLYGSDLYWDTVTLSCDLCGKYIGNADVHCDNKKAQEALEKSKLAKDSSGKMNALVKLKSMEPDKSW